MAQTGRNMSMSDGDLAAVESAIGSAVGQRAWGTALGTGSFLTVEFGPQRPPQPPRPGQHPRPHGVFHLWVYCSAWRIDSPTEVIASSEDPRDQLATTIRRLDGLTLAGAQIERPSLSAAFRFHDGTTLHTFSIFSTGYEHWMFYLPDGNVFTAGPGTGFSWGR
jgi:hypothetical protein